MKILHTADWHIGKLLYKQSLDEEFDLFIKWLIELVKKEDIDAILISGDVFDLANPSNASRRVYYSALKELSQLKLKVIVTGGNHDSIHQLQASADILSLLDIVIVGGLPEDINECIIPLDIRNEQVIIGAIPYIRDKDVRKGGDFDKELDRVQMVKKGIESVYSHLKDEMQSVDGYESAPLIAMGHLYLQHSQTSDSERDIQVGNLAGLESGTLSDMFDYVALGHIHRPQMFDGGKVRYSGSPIPLSFSERKDEKEVVIVEINNGTLSSSATKCPTFRHLLRVEGMFDEIQQKINDYTSNSALPTYIEVIVKEKEYSYTLLNEVRRYIQSLERADVKVLKEKVVFESNFQTLNTSMPEVEIQDVKPKDVFVKRLESEDLSLEDRSSMVDGFDQLYQEVSDQIG